MLLPNALNAGWTNALRFRHRAHAPVSRGRRLGAQCRVDDGPHFPIRAAGQTTRPGGVLFQRRRAGALLPPPRLSATPETALATVEPLAGRLPSPVRCLDWTPRRRPS